MPVPASAQASQAAQPAQSTRSAERPRPDPPPAAWVLAGVDLGLHDRWRGSVRIGHLGDIDSRIAIADITFAARPAMQILFGHVRIAPAASGAPRSTLTRAGVTWLPLRRRVTLDDRFLVERRTTTGVRALLRIRNRVRIAWPRPDRLPAGLFASIETIAAITAATGSGPGVAEHRIQIGGMRAVGRLSLDGYWLHRRLPAHARVNGIGLTAAWRIGR